MAGGQQLSSGLRGAMSVDIGILSVGGSDTWNWEDNSCTIRFGIGVNIGLWSRERTYELRYTQSGISTDVNDSEEFELLEFGWIAGFRVVYVPKASTTESPSQNTDNTDQTREATQIRDTEDQN